MKTIRIIPKIDVKGPNVVKGIHLEGLRVLGTPNSFARYYYEHGADELIYMDVVASLYNRNSILDMVRKTAENIFIPITVGGGIRTIDDISAALNSGADKVSINTAAINDNDLVSRAVDKFGSSTIVIAIEAIKQSDGGYQAFTDNGREYTGMDVVEWAKKAESLGAGEVLLTSVDAEGTGKGCDIELVNSVTNVINIPTVAHGGIGKADDVIDVIKSSNVSGIALGSILHYDTIKNIQLSDGETSTEGNRDFLNSKRNSMSINACSIPSIKERLLEYDIAVRV